MAVAVTVNAYECESCKEHTLARSPWAEDYPEGYYVTLRRVTEALNHKQSDEVYLCSKECLMEFMKYGISIAVQQWRPVHRAAPRNAKPATATQSTPLDPDEVTTGDRILDFAEAVGVSPEVIRRALEAYTAEVELEDIAAIIEDLR